MVDAQGEVSEVSRGDWENGDNGRGFDGGGVFDGGGRDFGWDGGFERFLDFSGGGADDFDDDFDVFGFL